MSRIKVDLSRVSLNQLCILTGKTSRTLKALLAEVSPIEESGTLYYAPAAVLPLIYTPKSSESGARQILDASQERARLDKLKADKVELEVEQLKGTLIPAASVKEGWEKLCSAFRSRILLIPTKVAPRVCAVREIKAIEKILKGACSEALTELAQYGDGPTGRTSPRSG